MPHGAPPRVRLTRTAAIRDSGNDGNVLLGLNVASAAPLPGCLGIRTQSTTVARYPNPPATNTTRF